MYPLNMSNTRLGGYAVANDIDEHRNLTALGYEPALVEEEKPRRGRPPKAETPAEEIPETPAE